MTAGQRRRLWLVPEKRRTAAGAKLGQRPAPVIALAVVTFVLGAALGVILAAWHL